MWKDENSWWVYTWLGDGGKEIIKNKLMRGINYSINASNVPPRAEFRGRNGKRREIAREKMSSRGMNRGENEIWRGRREEDLLYCWNVKLKPLSLMPANWLSRPMGFASAGKLPSLNQQKLGLCHLKLYIFILHKTSSKHTHYLC